MSLEILGQRIGVKKKEHIPVSCLMTSTTRHDYQVPDTLSTDTCHCMFK